MEKKCPGPMVVVYVVTSKGRRDEIIAALAGKVVFQLRKSERREIVCNVKELEKLWDKYGGPGRKSGFARFWCSVQVFFGRTYYLCYQAGSGTAFTGAIGGSAAKKYLRAGVLK